MLWSEEKKAMVGMAVGCLAYTSSGESLFWGWKWRKAPYRVSCEKVPGGKVKKALDDVYIRSLHPRARVNLVTRHAHARPSTRCWPVKGLQWTVTWIGSCYSHHSASGNHNSSGKSLRKSPFHSFALDDRLCIQEQL